MLARTVSGFLGILVASAALSAVAGAPEFRIETEVFVNRGKEPASESLTLFAGGHVYDFLLTGSQEIAIFDPSREQFNLLHVGRQKKLTLSRDEILSLLAMLKASPRREKDPFFFAPSFDVSHDEPAGTLTLSSQRMTYRVQGSRPADPAASQQFQTFADWYARLNATVPGCMPPFARLELNKALAARGLIPETVELTINPTKRLLEDRIQVTSRHVIIWQLSHTDRARIEKAGTYLATFQPVSFREYRQLDSVAATRSPATKSQ